MGIDFSHGGAQWSYSGFACFRRSLAAFEGIELAKMAHFGGDRTWESVSSPLRAFLDHSDCDGELSPDDCRTIAPRLREAVDAIWEPGDYDHQSGLELADGMDSAAAAGEPLEFL